MPDKVVFSVHETSLTMSVKLCVFMNFDIKLPRLYIHEQGLTLTFVTSPKCKVTWEKINIKDSRK